MTLSAERRARIRLARSANVGPVSFRMLIDRFGSALAALEAVPAIAARGGGRAPRIADDRLIDAELRATAALGGRYLILGDHDYPAALAASEGAPAVLTLRGDAALLERRAVAMVGARNASAAACRFARGLARDLADAGVAVVSGLARGIDTAAHQGALDGGTIAVIAGGADIVYPPENAALQEEIAARGLLIAEMPPGTEPRARHFPHRNRIIAGLAAGTVVVEAAPRSGSLITARLAAEAGREVMAVPGSPLDPRAQGCNGLIRDGATLIQSAADILETLAPIGEGLVASPNETFHSAALVDDAADADRVAITDLLGPVAVPVDELIRLSGLPSASSKPCCWSWNLPGGSTATRAAASA
ncbi:DNA processing protein [Sphingomonas jejuensis]|uniref:DNA processing protein n=1 Tax=Sphingomonas jejuensis TaxID=904715 RepID=A0ABX0XK88_9SPHN|nr:DNA processing protein [Sphingomonas jejuensis]